jgi:hypothetical protein
MNNLSTPVTCLFWQQESQQLVEKGGAVTAPSQLQPKSKQPIEQGHVTM